MYYYVKALHIIFIVTWFSGMFYIVRLFIYNTEAAAKQEPERSILMNQFAVMIRRLWLGITWPSAVLTLILGIWMWSLLGSLPGWLALKLIFVGGLYSYHLSLHFIYRQQARHVFAFTSQQLRIWNEVATIFLFAIVFIAVVKESMSWVKGLLGLAVLALILISAVRIYKRIRSR
ncbi:MAG TPA: CopD family protein [Puia sp.]|nr:CopD family protein [Puia sp.]